MAELSPIAQAVLDAFLGDSEDTGLQMDDLRKNVAAALRAAADHLDYIDSLYEIAAELEDNDHSN